MEGRDKCEFKINKPLKFLTGRADCISDDPEGRDYVTTKEEVSLFTYKLNSYALYLCILGIKKFENWLKFFWYSLFFTK